MGSVPGRLQGIIDRLGDRHIEGTTERFCPLIIALIERLRGVGPVLEQFQGGGGECIPGEGDMPENQQFGTFAHIDRGSIEDRAMKHDLAIELGSRLANSAVSIVGRRDKRHGHRRGALPEGDRMNLFCRP